MKCAVCCLVSICFLLGLFFGAMYVMVMVDPGLLELGDKAADMIRVDRGKAAPASARAPARTNTVLPDEDYMDAPSLLRSMLP